MQQPNPWLLFVGGIALLNVSPMAWGLSAPIGVRYAATILCVALGLLAMGLGLVRFFKKNTRRPAVRAAGRPSVVAGSAARRPIGAAAGAVRPRPGAATKDA